MGRWSSKGRVARRRMVRAEQPVTPLGPSPIAHRPSICMTVLSEGGKITPFATRERRSRAIDYADLPNEFRALSFPLRTPFARTLR